MRKYFPDSFQTFLATGLVQKSEKDYQGAIDSFSMASNIKPDAFRPIFEKSIVMLVAGKREQAVANLKVAEKKIESLKDLKKIRNIQQFLEAAS
jgi:hypothetical protein